MADLVHVARRLVAGWAEPEPPLDRARFASRAAASAIALIVAAVATARTVRPIVADPAPAALADGPDGVRFGLTETERRDLFRELAAGEAYRRQQGLAGFPDQPWSQEDHRAAYERDAVRGLAARKGLSLAQVYLALDEGIRAHWPGADGKPLVPNVVPLAPRRK